MIFLATFRPNEGSAQSISAVQSNSMPRHRPYRTQNASLGVILELPPIERSLRPNENRSPGRTKTIIVLPSFWRNYPDATRGSKDPQGRANRAFLNQMRSD
jgi:hypothetical protein